MFSDMKTRSSSVVPTISLFPNADKPHQHHHNESITISIITTTSITTITIITTIIKASPSPGRWSNRRSQARKPSRGSSSPPQLEQPSPRSASGTTDSRRCPSAPSPWTPACPTSFGTAAMPTRTRPPWETGTKGSHEKFKMKTLHRGYRLISYYNQDMLSAE